MHKNAKIDYRQNFAVILLLLLLIIFLIFSHTVHASSTATVDNDTSSGSGPASNYPPKEETPTPIINYTLVECQYQCTINGKKCLNQGTAESVCNSEDTKCQEQCAATGKPTDPVPPPAYVPPPIPQPQESPELIACKHQCEIDIKNCSVNGIYQNKCNKDKWACDDKCIAKFPLIIIQPPEQIQLLDYGDAPDPSFPSLKSSNGARHVNTQYEWLGLNITKESDSRQIDADDKDDGVNITYLYSLNPCIQQYLPVIVSVKSRDDSAHVYSHDKLLYLNMLFDWDLNGKWKYGISCPGFPGFSTLEHAVFNYPIDVSTWPQGVTTKTVIVPLQTGIITQNMWVRVTLTYNQPVALTWDGTGEFNFGETEDYGPRNFTENPPYLRQSSSEEENAGEQENPQSTLPKKSESSSNALQKNESDFPENANEKSSEVQETPELPLSKKINGSECRGNSECQSNICKNGVCTNLVEDQQTAQPKITISKIVKAINGFFSRLFGRAQKT